MGEESICSVTPPFSSLCSLCKTLHYGWQRAGDITCCTGGISGFTVILCKNLETVPVPEFSATPVMYCTVQAGRVLVVTTPSLILSCRAVKKPTPKIGVPAETMWMHSDVQSVRNFTNNSKHSRTAIGSSVFLGLRRGVYLK